MNKLVGIATVAIALSAPLLSFAESDQPVTRAQVRAELIQLQKAGYNPAVASAPNYPADIQAAEARVAAQQAYGGEPDGSAQSGSRATGPVPVQGDASRTFAHH